ncbi:hypothetical protein LV79_006349 [Actinokineospora globicatena]|nr:hypothetical protein [Actinokineospora globicatena]GLW82050.1 hypothetical protein Aglo01_65310 [Actinokineospora globicatena]GLW88844.1 hypothetical protein Aglo02_64830 [Actinokineospora globicatena]
MGKGIAAALVLVLLLVGSPAQADGAPVGQDTAVAQTLGGRELTVTLRRTDGAPAPLQVDVITHVGSPPGTLRLAATPAGESPTSTATINLRTGSTTAYLRVDRYGPWELELSDGTTSARIPFAVAERVSPAWERTVYGGFVAAGLFLLLSLLLATRSSKLALIPAAALVAALATATTAALLSSTIPPKSTQDRPRPPVNLAVEATATELVLTVTDSVTGRPVDDLQVHHGALIHLAIVSARGTLTHVHPVRTAPGDYRVQFAPTDPGRHTMAAEFTRLGGGQQQVRAQVDIAGEQRQPPTPAKGTVTTTPLRAGDPATLTVDFTGPDDLQPWLGMRGHLILTDDTQAVWAHVHAMATTAAAQPDETVAAYPAEVGFTFTFPHPGRYRAWFQAERGYEILTIAATFDVAP